jgi:D-xylose transport system ATP-binding protein
VEEGVRSKSGFVLKMTEAAKPVSGPSERRAPEIAGYDLYLAFGGVQAVRGVSVEVHGGEVVALLGDNGAGKSTTLKILAGVIQPDQGRIMVSGEEVRLRSPHSAQERGIDTVYQDLALADSLDVVQNIFCGRELHRLGVLRRAEMEHRTKQLLEEVDVHIPNTVAPVRLLSGGQRQATAITRAIGWGSRVLLLDEPTAALGVNERAHVLSVIRTLRARGLAVLIISHSLPDVFGVADRLVVLRRGEVVGSAAVKDVDENDVVGMITGLSSRQRGLRTTEPRANAAE